MTRTVVLHPRYDEDSQRIWQAAVDIGWPIVRLDGYGILAGEVSPWQLAVSPPVVYGGYMWGARIAEQLGARLIGPCDDWLARQSPSLTKRTIAIKRVGDLLGEQWPLFVKSLRGKSIESRVYQSPSELSPSLDDDEFVIIQEPVQWLTEIRFFISEGRIAAYSLYGRHGDLARGLEVVEPELSVRMRAYDEASNFVIAALPSIVDMPRAYVLDVGNIDGRGWAIVEANPAWCSGLYDCDAAAALQVITLCTELA